MFPSPSAITRVAISRLFRVLRCFFGAIRSNSTLPACFSIGWHYLLIARCRPPALFGAPFYVVEQLGFRKLVDTTFMIGHLATESADRENVERYFKALRRAQRDIDLSPELYKHYLLRELPERYHPLVDVRRFGPGERLVFEPYPQDAFERTRRWIESWNLFRPEQTGGAGYHDAVI